MALSNAEKQARWRVKRNALAAGHPDVTENALLQEAERCGELSAEARTALADKLADAAMTHLRRAQALGKVAQRVRGT